MTPCFQTLTVAYMILGQAAPAGGVLTPLYVTPAGTVAAHLEELLVCNRAAAPDSFSVAVGTGGGGNQEWIYYDLPVDANNSFWLNGAKITLAPGQGVYVRSTNGTASFSLFGEVK